jgi:L-fuconolactonase
MSAIARRSAAYCKLSGLVTEASDGWSLAMLEPYLDHLLHAFGADRLIFGSDWPVVNLAGGYDGWWEAMQTWLDRHPPTVRDAILGGNAVRAYRL